MTDYDDFIPTSELRAKLLANRRPRKRRADADDFDKRSASAKKAWQTRRENGTDTYKDIHPVVDNSLKDK